MSGAREIVGKIRSVKNTKKVTKALEMVSASKIRKSQELMSASRPYAKMIRQVVGHLSEANPEYRHPFMVEREQVNAVGYIVVSTDRGLCGGLNSNQNRLLINHIQEQHDNGAAISMVAIGRKANQYFRNISGIDVVATTSGLGEQPRLEDLIGVIKTILDSYREGQVDRLYLSYTDFINTMTQQPLIRPLLPLPHAKDEEQLLQNWDYLYEPEPRELLDYVLTRYIESLVYQAVLENLASEHAARMVAMKSASDNASDLIDDLNLVYNKARQAAITQEISEIVSGAAAV